MGEIDFGLSNTKVHATPSDSCYAATSCAQKQIGSLNVARLGQGNLHIIAKHTIQHISTAANDGLKGTVQEDLGYIE